MLTFALVLFPSGVSKSASSTLTTPRSPRSTGTRLISACPRSAASRSRARWVEVDARVEVWRADKDGDTDGDAEGGEAAGGRALGRLRDP
ncbi:hypothetical protein B0H14DRAFT_3509696 [Mycena olivaceomarginata]|nr:hypothetical protein B0H14DRAFT_3509696 [Mycena olivaceomarginata]